MPPSSQTPACIKCYSRKRKCDKQLPACSYCSRRGMNCVYPTTGERLPRSRSDVYFTPPAVAATSLDVAVSSPPACNPAASFPAVFYLDRDVFHNCRVEIPEPSVSIPQDILGLIGQALDWTNTAQDYFATAHIWMPIISKKRFFEKVLGHMELRADYALLILCMDLIKWNPDGHNPRTPAYHAAKHFYLDLEIAGLRTIQVLQAGILIALYEIGHAIFPSAAASIESCIRFGYDLGIDWNSSRSARRPFAWVDAEEQNRVWWAILILDCIRSLGSPNAKFLIEDPPSNIHLPADDSAWDQGVMPPAQLSSLSPKSIDDLGCFSLAAEATKLLRRVFKHVKANNFHKDAHNEEAKLLDGALRALENLVETGGHEKMVDVMNQVAMCSIALSVLHEAHIAKRTGMAEIFRNARHAEGTTNVVGRSREESARSISQRPIQSCIKDASPILTSQLYFVAVAILRIHREEGSQESLQRLTTMRAALKEFNQRWRASGELHLLIDEALLTF